MNPVARVWLPALAVLILWWLCAALAEPHHIADAATPAGSFSAARAQRVLAALLGADRPHPVGSAEEAAAQARIVAQFTALGIPVHTYRAFVCNPWRGFSFIPCATVNDILAEVVPGEGPAVLMMAHADSVVAGPGAADDGAGVACVLEAARALRATAARTRPPAHPVMALISDGEEAGLLGAAAFLQNPALAARVGAAVNLEARGTRGASLLFQMSPGDARLLHLYATHVAFSAASSLFSTIYRHLPNDTDLTLFIRAGVPSMNFAIAENVQAYHSPLDRLAALSGASLQMQGDNLLAMVRALEVAPFASLRGSDALYVSMLGYFLPRMPAAAALPLAWAVLLLMLWASWRAPGTPERPAAAPGTARRAAWAPPVMIGGSVLIGYALAMIAAVISGTADPTYAHPLAMRLALGLALWLMLLLTSTMGSARQMASAAWLWMASLGLLAAWQLPALAPYLLWPSALAAVLLWMTARAPGGWEGPWGRAACSISAGAALILWLPLATGSEALMGLRLHAAFTLSAALGLTTLLPLLAARRPPRPIQRASVIVSAAGAVVCALVAGFLPAYSPQAPERLNLLYLEDLQGAHWIADGAWNTDTSAPLPQSLRNAANFHAQPLALPGLVRRSTYVTAAGSPRLPLPLGRLEADVTRAGERQVTLRLLGSAGTDEMDLYIPAAAQLRSLELRGQHLVAPSGWSGSTTLLCVSRDCNDETVTLHLAAAQAAAPISLAFVEHRHGLPPFGDFLRAARGPRAMPSQNGDEVLLAGQMPLPAPRLQVPQ